MGVKAVVFVLVLVGVAHALPSGSTTQDDVVLSTDRDSSGKKVEAAYRHGHRSYSKTQGLIAVGQPAESSAGANSSQVVEGVTVIVPNVKEIPCARGCRFHGECNYTTGVCKCESGWHGLACNEAYKCVDNCNLHGLCLGDNQCVCHESFSGEACEFDKRCPDDCSGHGECISDGQECECAEGWEGEICDSHSVPLVDPRTWTKLFPLEESTDKGSRPVGRTQLGAAQHGSDDSVVLVWGGEAEAQPLDDMWLFDVHSSQWRQKAQLGVRPGPRYSHSLSTAANFVYMFGGFEPCDATADAFSSDLWRWDVQDESWSLFPMLLESGLTQGPAGRSGHSAVATDSMLIVFGGLGDQSVTHSDVWRFNFVSGKWGKGTPSNYGSRRFHTATYVGSNKMWVFGGLDADGNTHNSLLQYSVGEDKWETIDVQGTPPSPRSHHSAVYKDGRLFVFGGGEADASVADMHAIGTDLLTWEQVSASGAASNSGMAMVLSGSTMLSFGGSANPDEVLSLSKIEFNVEAGATFTGVDTVGSLPLRTMMQSGNVIEDTLWVFGGETGTGKRLDELWGFDLKAQQWQQHTPTATAAKDSATIYSCGVQATGESNDGVAVTPSSVQWPSARSAHATAVASSSAGLCGEGSTDSALVMFGGTTAAKTANDIWQFCPSSQQWTELSPGSNTSFPVARSSSAVFVTEKLFIFGGMDEDRVRLNDMWECDLATATCIEIVEVDAGQRPHTRRSMNFFFDPRTGVSQYLVFGGYYRESGACATCAGVMRSVGSDFERPTDVWRYDTAYRRWRKINGRDPPDQRFVPGSVVSRDRLFMFGGYAIDGILEHSDMWYFNLNAQQWRRLPVVESGDHPAGRHELTLNVWENEDKTHIVVFGGIGTSGLLGDVWVTDVTDVFSVSDHQEDASTRHVRHVQA